MVVLPLPSFPWHEAQCWFQFAAASAAKTALAQKMIGAINNAVFVVIFIGSYPRLQFFSRFTAKLKSVNGNRNPFLRIGQSRWEKLIQSIEFPDEVRLKMSEILLEPE
jgi:hypothetical protein